MTKELKHFDAVPFYKAIIGANNMTNAKRRNMPKQFQTYPEQNCKSFQDHGHFQIRESFRLSKRKL